MAKELIEGESKFVITEAGDTLWAIAKDAYDNPYKWTYIAEINNIPDERKLAVGAKLALNEPAAVQKQAENPPDKGRPTITMFGRLTESSSPQLYAVWSWNQKNTDHYEYEWEYTMVTTGSTWWSASKGTTEDQESLCSIPENAELVRFRVKPIAENKESSGTSSSTPYWTANWSKYKEYDTSELPPEKPDQPSVKIDDNDPFVLTTELSGVDAEKLNATHIQFQVVLNNTINFATSSPMAINTEFSYVSWTCDTRLTEGGTYAVRCRAVRDNKQSGWSSFSSSVSAPPARPEGFTTCIAKSKAANGAISVYMEWNAVDGATGYDIEYAEKVEYFDVTDRVASLVTGHTQTQYESFDMYSGSNGGNYYLRLRASKGDYKSQWSEPSMVTLGQKPEAPTTWSSTGVSSVGGPLTLYWVHNSTDGSDQSIAKIYLEIQQPNTAGNYVVLTTDEVTKTYSADEEVDDISSFDATAHLSTSFANFYKDGVRLVWRVRTAGVTGELGEWSISRTIDIHAQPELHLQVRDAMNIIDAPFDTLGSLPIYISTVTSPATQAPIGFHVSVISNSTYETVDATGRNKMVNTGEIVYSKYFDQNLDLDDVEISAGDIDLESGISYTITCTAAMNSGLTVEKSLTFTVDWVEVTYIPDATIVYDTSRYITQICPRCNIQSDLYYAVQHNPGPNTYNVTDTRVYPITQIPYRLRYTLDGYLIESELVNDSLRYYYVNRSGRKVYLSNDVTMKYVDVYTTTGEKVYYGSQNDERVYFYIKTSEVPVEGVRLSVYRREFDGSFTELARDIDNTKNTYVTDPHPALDFARYRIVATAQSTGAVSYYDVPGYPTQEKAVIIQWNEEWSNFDISGDEIQSQPAWSGSLLRLPYNIDVTDSYDMDVSHVEYVGRKRPVAYYGTQLGETSSWSVEIEKDDEETLYALRRLAIWPGNVYVREPSGTGYWATVTPNFSQKHKDLTIPVNLIITRVEGGA